jgi:hypothetical protein
MEAKTKEFLESTALFVVGSGVSALLAYVTRVPAVPPGKATVRVLVKDESTGQLIDATVTLNTYTPIRVDVGVYEFREIPVGVYTLTASKEGYATKSVVVDARTGGFIQVEVRLTPITAIPEYTVTVENTDDFWTASIICFREGVSFNWNIAPLTTSSRSIKDCTELILDTVLYFVEAGLPPPNTASVWHVTGPVKLTVARRQY